MDKRSSPQSPEGSQETSVRRGETYVVPLPYQCQQNHSPKIVVQSVELFQARGMYVHGCLCLVRRTVQVLLEGRRRRNTLELTWKRSRASWSQRRLRPGEIHVNVHHELPSWSSPSRVTLFGASAKTDITIASSTVDMDPESSSKLKHSHELYPGLELRDVLPRSSCRIIV